MHNIKLLRENINDFKKKLSNRNFDFNVKEFEDLDKYNRKLISQREKLEQEKKILSYPQIHPLYLLAFYLKNYQKKIKKLRKMKQTI